MYEETLLHDGSVLHEDIFAQVEIEKKIVIFI